MKAINTTQKEWVNNYKLEGACILNNLLPQEQVKNARKEIAHILRCMSNAECNIYENEQIFSKKATEIIYTMLEKTPEKRAVLYNYIQKIPSLFQVASNDKLLDFARDIGILNPSVIEAKVQMFLPWEKMFFQDCHQDINSLGSPRSITFWIPMQELFEHTAVRYWVGSHNEGPVVHEKATEIPEQGIFIERVPKNIQKKYKTIKTAACSPGDVIAINRLTFHQSPEYDKQMNSRWSFVIRFDDLDSNSANDSSNAYEKFTPYPVSKQADILKSIKKILNQKPNPHWQKEKTCTSK